MTFDFKKEYKEYYQPPKKPSIIDVPPLPYLCVRGTGNPNEEEGEYSAALSALYGVAYTLKMSYKGSRVIEGFFEYVVPPLEGLWWQEGVAGFDSTKKDELSWLALIRLPDFITPKDVMWAVAEATRKKRQDYSLVEYLCYDEGLCVQCMHIGPYDDEPATVRLMDAYADEQGYVIDLSAKRHHHEVYLGDPRKSKPEALKTVVRHPIKPR